MAATKTKKRLAGWTATQERLALTVLSDRELDAVRDTRDEEVRRVQALIRAGTYNAADLASVSPEAIKQLVDQHLEAGARAAERARKRTYERFAARFHRGVQAEAKRILKIKTQT